MKNNNKKGKNNNKWTQCSRVKRERKKNRAASLSPFASHPCLDQQSKQMTYCQAHDGSWDRREVLAPEPRIYKVQRDQKFPQTAKALRGF